MPETKQIDLSKYSAGSIYAPKFAGEPVDSFKHLLLNRAAVPLTDTDAEGNDVVHPLRTGIVLDQTRLGYPLRPDNGRLPIPFDPTPTEDNTLISVADWFRYLEQPGNTWTHDQYTAYLETEAEKTRQNLGTRVAVNQIFGAPIIPVPQSTVQDETLNTPDPIQPGSESPETQ